MNGVSMTPHMKLGIAGIVIGLILFIISPWVALAVIAAAIAIPVVAWRMLDESQRRRYREVRRRQRGQLR
jgi:Flp pilus assembly protein TadB